MQAKQSILDRIQRSQLKWKGHLLRIEDSRCSKIYRGHRTKGAEEEDRNNYGKAK